MRDVLLVRFGEVHLKGLNRPYFLRKLVDNIKRAVEPMGGHVWMSDSRIYVRDCPDMEACARRVSRVFGVHSVSPAVEMEKDLQAICQQCAAMTKDLKGTFKVLARRSDKSFPLDSMALQREIGGKVLEGNPNLTVDVHNPQYKLNVEIRDNCYLCVREMEAVGGMPMGTGGKAMLLLSGGIDSPVASWMMAKGGAGAGGTLLLLSLHQPAGQGKGLSAGPHSGRIWKRHAGARGAFYPDSDGNP